MQSNLPLHLFSDKGDTFYANVYVSDDKMMFHESIPGVSTSPLAIGVPITYITHNVSSLRPIKLGYQLSTQHMRKAGFTDIADMEVKEKVLAVAMEEAVPAWRSQARYVSARILTFSCKNVASVVKFQWIASSGTLFSTNCTLILSLGHLDILKWLCVYAFLKPLSVQAST